MQTQESRQLLGLDGELARRLVETRVVARAGESDNYRGDVAAALGTYGVYLVQYADEINAALDADDELVSLTLDVEPTVELLEHAHAVYEQLPDQAQLGISCSSWDCCYPDANFPLRDVREALEGLEAAGKLSRADRLAAFMLIINTVPLYGVHEFGEWVGVDAASLREETD